MTEKTKILLITAHFPPKRGGVESHNVEYLDFFEEQQNFQVTVLTYDNRERTGFSDKWTKSEVVRIKVPTALLGYMIGLKSVSNLHSPFRRFLYVFLHSYFFLAEALVRFKEIRQVDMILANGALVESIAGRAISVLTRRKYSVRWHTDLSGVLANLGMKLSLKGVANIVVNGSDIKDKMVKMIGIGEPRVSISKHPIDTEVFHPIRQEISRRLLGLPLDKFIILFAAPLNRTKFCDLMVDSAPRLLKDSSGFFLILIGEGPLEAAVEKLKRSYESNVLFINHFVDAKKLNLFVNAADITVSCADVYYPSRTILESLACGTPTSIFDTVRREERRSGTPRFNISLPQVFIVSSSPSGLSSFLMINQSKIRQKRSNRQLIETARQYVLQNHNSDRIIKNEIMRLLDSGIQPAKWQASK